MIDTSYILIFTALGIISVGFYLRDFPITMFGGFFTLMMGIYVTLNGIGSINTHLVRMGLGFILIGIGAYVSIRGGYEQFKND